MSKNMPGIFGASEYCWHVSKCATFDLEHWSKDSVAKDESTARVGLDMSGQHEQTGRRMARERREMWRENIYSNHVSNQRDVYKDVSMKLRRCESMMIGRCVLWCRWRCAVMTMWRCCGDKQTQTRLHTNHLRNKPFTHKQAICCFVTRSPRRVRRRTKRLERRPKP